MARATNCPFSLMGIRLLSLFEFSKSLFAAFSWAIYCPLMKAIFVFFGMCVLTAQAKTWHSADGTKTFEAQFVSYQPPTVVVQKPSGQRMNFDEQVLSEADRNYCRAAAKVLGQSIADFPFLVVHVSKQGVLCREDQWSKYDAIDKLIKKTEAQIEEKRDAGATANQLALTYGVLSHLSGEREEELNNISKAMKKGAVFFLRGDFSGSVADEQKLRQNLFWSGTYSYRATDGTQRTVHSFCTDLDSAIEILSNP